ncbi:MAG: hypothetical protein ACKO04_10925 [Actinomycetes bacterium]
MLELKWNAATIKVDAVEVDPGAAAVVADADGERGYATLGDAVSSDPALVVTPQTVVARVGGLPEGAAPDEWFFEMFAARFDPEAWASTYYDSCFGQGNWSVEVDGEQAAFHLTGFEPSVVPEHPAPAGELVVLENGGFSMSTGPIGLSVGIDRDGMSWASRWGMDTWFLGPVTGDDLLAEARRGLDILYLDGWLDIFRVRTDLLTPDQLRMVVEHLIDDDTYVLFDETEVEGPGCSTTAGALFPDRVKSIEATHADPADGAPS